MTARLDMGRPSPFAHQVLAVLGRYLSPPTARSVLAVAVKRQALTLEAIGPEHIERIAPNVRDGMALFVSFPRQIDECLAALRRLEGASADEATPLPDAIEVVLRGEEDIVRARGEARAIAVRAAFSEIARTRVTTAVSELARNIVRYAGEGTITLCMGVVDNGRAYVEIVAADRGPGIADIGAVLSGTYRSKHGMGLGLRGVKRIAASFDIQTSQRRGTTIRVRIENE